MSKIRIIDAQSSELLASFSVENSEAAYAFATQMEEAGLDIKMESPSITETLAFSLGLEGEELEEYRRTVLEEIEDHEGSCCATSNDNQKIYE